MTKHREHGKRIKSVEELRDLADKRLSAVSGYFGRRTPASVLLRMQAVLLLNLIDQGVYLYIPQGRSPRKSFNSWAKLCGMEVTECKEHSLDCLPKRLSFDSFHRTMRLLLMNGSIGFCIADVELFGKYKNANHWKDIIN